MAAIPNQPSLAEMAKGRSSVVSMFLAIAAALGLVIVGVFVASLFGMIGPIEFTLLSAIAVVVAAMVFRRLKGTPSGN